MKIYNKRRCCLEAKNNSPRGQKSKEWVLSIDMKSIRRGITKPFMNVWAFFAAYIYIWVYYSHNLNRSYFN